MNDPLLPTSPETVAKESYRPHTSGVCLTVGTHPEVLRVTPVSPSPVPVERGLERAGGRNQGPGVTSGTRDDDHGGRTGTGVGRSRRGMPETHYTLGRNERDGVEGGDRHRRNPGREVD